MQLIGTGLHRISAPEHQPHASPSLAQLVGYGRGRNPVQGNTAYEATRIYLPLLGVVR